MKENNFFCKSCFKDINQHSFKSIFNSKSILCDDCYEKFEVINAPYKIENIKGEILYKYNDFFKEKLYTLKGCYDIELSRIFLDKIKHFLNFLYKDYVIVPAPSSKESNEIRGFKHLNEIFKVLNLPILDFFIKNKNIKQSDLGHKERKRIKEIIEVNKTVCLANKKILFVDDVLTTGSTAKACLNLIKSQNPKKLKFIILSSKNDFK